MSRIWQNKKLPVASENPCLRWQSTEKRIFTSRSIFSFVVLLLTSYIKKKLNTHLRTIPKLKIKKKTSLPGGESLKGTEQIFSLVFGGKVVELYDMSKLIYADRGVTENNLYYMDALNQCCGAGAATFRVEPKQIFYGGFGSGYIFLASKKGKPCCCEKPWLKSNL